MRAAALGRLELDGARAPLQAVGRGATEFRMGARIESRLLALGLIAKAREGYRLTDAGRASLGRTQWS
jgi:hypothetical protein